MNTPFRSRVGGILSADVAVPDHERVQRFYASVLTTGSSPFWREDLMNSNGVPVIGVGARSPELEGLPLQWMPHIQVRDVAQSAARAVELGGKEMLHGKADDGTSQWAVLLDRDGAAFGVIPVVPEEALPATPADAPPAGHIAWVDLTVPDAAAARDFYREVVGWSVEDVSMSAANGDYADHSMLAGDGEAAAGVCHARGVNAGLPAAWMLYLPVGDLGDSLARVSREGGTIVRDAREGEFAHAVVRDPVGLWLTLVQG